MAGEQPIPPPIASDERDRFLAQVVVDTRPFDTHRSGSNAEYIVDPRRVAVPRSAIYLNGVLLILATIGCFSFGYLAGQGVERRRNRVTEDLSPRLVTGRVTYQSAGGERLPDGGAVVIAIREDERPQLQEKVQSAGLGPADPAPDARHSEVAKLSQLGGNYARTDAAGEFQFQVAQPGRYFLLIISHAGRRSPDVELSRTEMAQMSRLFSAPQDLIGDRRFRWLNESIVRDRRLVLDLE